MQQCWGDGRDENQQVHSSGCIHFPIKIHFTVPECILTFVIKKILQRVQFVYFGEKNPLHEFSDITLMSLWTTVSVYLN